MTYFLHSESALEQYPDLPFVTFYDEQVKTGYWRTSPGVEIFYAHAMHPNPKGCIVLLNGRAEAVVKYAELIFELYQNGYSVFTIDHRGQGSSSRLQDNLHLGFVDSFDAYVKDAKSCIDNILLPLLKNDYNNSGQPLYMLCHSMGAAIGNIFLSKYPDVFNKACFCAPMFGIKMPLPESIAKWIAKTAISVRSLLRLPIRYFWGQGDYQPYPFHTNRLTNSKARYRVFREIMAQHPKAQLGGVSFEWFYQAVLAMQITRKSAPAVLIPVLILQAEQELVVDNTKMNATFEGFPNAQLIKIPKAQHEILFEKDPAKHLALSSILDFYASE